MPTELDNRVLLDGKEYAIREGVRAQPASEFEAGLRQGSPQYDSRLGSFTLTLEDWSGGLGILDADERKNEHQRVRYSDGLDTRFPKSLQLGPKITTVALAGVTFPSGIPQAKIRQWGDYLIFGVGTQIFKLDSALAITNIRPPTFAADVGVNAEHADLLVHDFNDGFFANNPAILWGLKSTGAGGTLRQYYIAAATNITAVDWSPQGDQTPGFELNSMVSYDQKIIAVQGAVVKESNEGTTDTWTDLASLVVNDTFMTVPLFSTFIGTHRVPFGPDFMPWMLLGGKGGYQGKVAMIDYWARQLKPLELNIGRISSAYMLDDGVVLSNTYDLWKVIPGDPPSIIPLNLRKQTSGQGLAPEFDQGVISGLGSVFGELMCGFTNLKGSGNGRIWLLRHNGAGWHVVTEQQYDNAIILDIFQYEKPADFFGFRSTTYVCWITWDGTNCRFHYYKDAHGGATPEQDPAYEYASDGIYQTPWMYGGFEDMTGALLRLKIRAKGLSADETILVSYRLDEDDTAGWRVLGTFDNDTTELAWGTDGEGECFTSVRFRLYFSRGVTTTNTARVRALILLYDKKPLTRMAYNFVVDVARMIRESNDGDTNPFTGFTTQEPLTYRNVYDILRAAKDECLLIPFTYDDEPVRYVKVQALPSTEQEIHDAMRTGVITVQVVELVGGAVGTGGIDVPPDDDEEPPPAGEGETGPVYVSFNGLMVDEQADSPRRIETVGLSVDLLADSPRRTETVGLMVDERADSPRRTETVGLVVDESADSPRRIELVGLMVDYSE